MQNIYWHYKSTNKIIIEIANHKTNLFIKKQDKNYSKKWKLHAVILYKQLPLILNVVTQIFSVFYWFWDLNFGLSFSSSLKDVLVSNCFMFSYLNDITNKRIV